MAFILCKGLIMMRITGFILLFFLLSLAMNGQDSRLANQYYQTGEYEKAAEVYKMLLEKTPRNDYYFSRYIESLLAMENFQLAEKEIKKQISTQPHHVQLYVTYGNLYERQFMSEKADAQYRKAIDNVPPDIAIISKLGNAFIRLTKYDLAIEAFDKGGRIMNNDQIFAYNLADLYRRKGDVPRMIKYYIKASSNNPTQAVKYKTHFQRNLKTDEDYEELRKQLFERIQKEPDNIVYPELLEWVYIQKKEYNRALRQARALDRNLDENGTRVYNIADIAYNAGDYDTAIKAYEYIVDNKGINNSLYVDAKRGMLKSKRNKITRNYNYTIQDLDSLDFEYQKFIAEFGINARTDQLVKEYADFLAIYKNDLDASIEVLNQLIGLASINKYVKANSKISLADYFLMKGEVWEATLLYSQVEKDFTEEYLGEISRFKNARLAYFIGNFEWAQEQFDILKAATSRLISNDAIDLSVFIMDNLGLDTTDVPLQLYADAELLTFQNRFDEAFVKLDSIAALFPDHSLDDDVKYQKAKIYVKLNDFDTAIKLYSEVVEKYPEDIRADNSLFALGEIHENQLNAPDQAMKYYEKLFMDYSNSTFAVEARKRFRILRGDDIQ